jgi:hypothetical protein
MTAEAYRTLLSRTFVFNFVQESLLLNYNYQLVKEVGSASSRRQAEAYRTLLSSTFGMFNSFRNHCY